jgi:hypothetical protein
MAAGPAARELPRDRLMEERTSHLDPEHLGPELERLLRLAFLVENGDLRHDYCAFRARC